MPPHTALLVVAAGSGARMGRETPKQYLPLIGQPILKHTLLSFQKVPEITSILVVIGQGHNDLYDAAVAGLHLPSPVIGGARRQDSVRLGLEALASLAPDYVLIHDAARPFASPALVQQVITALANHPAVLPALAMKDSVKRVDAQGAAKSVDRAELHLAQTPQGFHFAPLLAAHRRFAAENFTDDAAVMEAAGFPVHLIPGEEHNFKITTQQDLKMAEYMASRHATRTETRMGTGIDVHRFSESPASSLRLCGIDVPHTHALEGHSDADVGLHAATDALLGAIAAGDIGQHFPPTEARWKGVDSSEFLRHAAALVRAEGGRIVHIDITIICEKPKVSPHRATMQKRVAEILDISPKRVSIKATTTEGLGFTGRAEGIAAQAAATIECKAEDT